MLRKLLYLASALLLGAGAFSGVQASGATFTDTSATPLSVFSAPDWTAPDVTMVDPGYAVTETVAVNATATDSESSIKNVQIQRAPHGSSAWTTICTDTDAPYSCSWDTHPLTDGEYDLRAVATDVHDNSRTSSSVMTTVQNAAGVVLDPVVGPVRGTVTLTGRIVNATGSATIGFQASTAGTNSWFDIPGCTPASGLVRTCQVNTTSITGNYDWRATGVVDGVSYGDIEANVLVDNTLPSVTLTVPAAPLSGTINVTGTASDGHSGVASVRFEYRKVGVASWTTCALDTSFPYTCALNTTGLSDGSYEFRDTATDGAGNQRVVSPTQTRAISNGSVTLAALPVAIRDTYGLTATWNGPGTPAVTFSRSSNGTSGWSTLCTDNSAPYACSWNTNADSLDSQRWYVRARAIVGSATYESIRSTVVDNEDPDIALTVPVAPLYGTVQLTATADDTDSNVGDESSGIAGVLFEYRRAGPANPWVSCGTDNGTPYACSLDTTALTTGNYEFRATATDGAGNTTTTTMQSRQVDNSPKVTMTTPSGPGSYAQDATVSLAASAWSQAGVNAVQFQYDPPGATSWTNACLVDNSAPYACDWSTTGLASGAYDVRAVMTPTTGPDVSSAPVAVTLEQLRGAQVDTTNNGISGRPTGGDKLFLTYSSTVALNTVRPASWNGSSTTASVTIADGSGNNPDYLTVPGTNLGTITFGQDFVDSGQQAEFDSSTIAATTTTYGGRTVTLVTITLSSVSVGSEFLNTANTNGAARWTPSASVTDTFGNACATTVAQEPPGAADVDL